MSYQLGLLGSNFGESDESGFDVLGVTSGGDPGTSSQSLAAVFALPDADSLSLESFFAAETADVFGVGRDFVLTGDFSEGASVSSAVFTGDSDFLGSFGH